MAVGIRGRFDAPPWNRVEGTLLLNAGLTGLQQGSWQPLLGYHPFTVTVEGTFTGTVTIYVSNAETQPADTDSAKPIIGPATGFTVPDSVDVNNRYRWIKADRNLSAGAVSVFLFG